MSSVKLTKHWGGRRSWGVGPFSDSGEVPPYVAPPSGFNINWPPWFKSLMVANSFEPSTQPIQWVVGQCPYQNSKFAREAAFDFGVEDIQSIQPGSYAFMMRQVKPRQRMYVIAGSSKYVQAFSTDLKEGLLIFRNYTKTFPRPHVVVLSTQPPIESRPGHFKVSAITIE